MKIAIVILLWLALGYVAEANWAAEFYGRFGPSSIVQVETRGSAVRSGLAVNFAFAPIAAPITWLDSEYQPMWDWPRYAFEAKKPLPK